MITIKVSFTQDGDLSKTNKFLDAMKRFEIKHIMDKYGRQGVAALSAATPKDSGATAAAWGYELKITSEAAEINWTNSNSNRGVNIAIILQYGHGTGTGGYVAGRDYINPAIRPVFDKIVEEAWREVVKS